MKRLLSALMVLAMLVCACAVAEEDSVGEMLTDVTIEDFNGFWVLTEPGEFGGEAFIIDNGQIVWASVDYEDGIIEETMTGEFVDGKLVYELNDTYELSLYSSGKLRDSGTDNSHYFERVADTAEGADYSYFVADYFADEESDELGKMRTDATIEEFNGVWMINLMESNGEIITYEETFGDGTKGTIVIDNGQVAAIYESREYGNNEITIAATWIDGMLLLPEGEMNNPMALVLYDSGVLRSRFLVNEEYDDGLYCIRVSDTAE